MPVVRDTVIPLRNYNGDITLPASNLPNDARYLQFEIARCTSVSPTIWPDVNTTVLFDFEVSTDNGATWRGLGGFGAAGGISLNRQGAEVPFSSFRIDLPEGTNRRIRGSVVVTNGPIRTSGTLEVGD